MASSATSGLMMTYFKFFGIFSSYCSLITCLGGKFVDWKSSTERHFLAGVLHVRPVHHDRYSRRLSHLLRLQPPLAGFPLHGHPPQSHEKVRSFYSETSVLLRHLFARFDPDIFSHLVTEIFWVFSYRRGLRLQAKELGIDATDHQLLGNLYDVYFNNQDLKLLLNLLATRWAWLGFECDGCFCIFTAS